MTAQDNPDISKQRDINFRADEISYILSRVKSGDSCSVVGVGSVGKSNLLRHLRRADTQTYHLGDFANVLKMVLVDPNNMLDSLPLQSSAIAAPNQDTRSSWAGYEIMTHRLYKAFYPFNGFADDEVKELTYAYSMLRDGQNPLLPHIGLRYLEHVLELLLTPASEGPQRRITFILDEFEEMLSMLPVRFFQTMRGLRDDYKYKVTFVTFTRRSLPQLVDENNYNRLALEPFVELFTDNTLYLGPYSDNDARAMLDRLSERRDVTFPPSFRGFLLRVSGGHAGLLRASFALAGQISFGTPESEALRFLINSKPTQDECQTIWDSLSVDERLTLKEILKRPGLLGKDELVVALLKDKQLVKGDDPALEVSPPLFREYVKLFAAVQDPPTDPQPD